MDLELINGIKIKRKLYSDFDEPDEGCIDFDKNGLCDILMPPHTIPDAGNIDRYPLSSWRKSDS